MNIERRGFLKLAVAMIGGTAVTRYAEPLVDMADTHRDWIEDKGDYCIIRVPDFKMFANEVIAKPVIFLLGQQAAVQNVDVAGYANVYAPKAGRVFGCRFDGSRMVTEQQRPLLLVKANGLVVDSCSLIGAGTAYGVA